MERDVKLTGVEVFLHLVERFNMTGYQAITTMIDRKQDLKWFEKLPETVQQDILKDK